MVLLTIYITMFHNVLASIHLKKFTKNLNTVYNITVFDYLCYFYKVTFFFLNSSKLLVLAPGLSKLIAWPHRGIISTC